MAGLLNKNFGGTQALGAFGDALSSLSSGKKINIAQLLQDQMKPEEKEAPPLGAPNPYYSLPRNALDETTANLNINPNLLPNVPSGASGGTGGGDPIAQLLKAVGQTESSGNYGALGKPTRRGDRAFGKYQVMGANIPAWSKEVLGMELTPEQFLNNPQAQDAIARAKLGSYYNKTGNIEDAASMWFSGRPMRGNQSRDILGTSVPEYVSRVRQQMNPGVQKYETQLTPNEEIKFQEWKKVYAPHDSGADYDLRGAYKSGLKPSPKNGHWPDTYKKPNHPTFSNQSIYARFAPNKAGTWNGETYIPNRNR